jgi:tyrosyl-tRNA synthetase
MNKSDLQKELLERGVVEVIDKPHLLTRLNSGKKLRIKLGIDPTSPNIHIGRAVVLWKLRAFQELGHKVTFIVGDFTGIIGDTSDKDAERPMLTPDQIKANLKTYFTQAYKILDKSKTEMHYNSQWLKKLGFAEIGMLADLFGLHEFEARENIAKRLKAGKRVSLRELLYPLMQGYDSVAVKADVELGGTDQRFNLLAGRVIQLAYHQAPQDILMTDLLEGLDGRKMSSSWGNTINITDEPENMFGKVMSLRDELVERYFLLATRVPKEEIKQIIKSTKHPRDLKIVLAETITELYHGAKAAQAAKAKFIAQFSEKQLPSDIPILTKKAGEYSLLDLLVEAQMVSSKSEARRVFEQKGVKINEVVAGSLQILLDPKTETIIQVGKRKFVKIKS